MVDNAPRREKGILYIATGKKFVEATIKSAISVKEFIDKAIEVYRFDFAKFYEI